MTNLEHWRVDGTRVLNCGAAQAALFKIYEKLNLAMPQVLIADSSDQARAMIRMVELGADLSEFCAGSPSELGKLDLFKHVKSTLRPLTETDWLLYGDNGYPEINELQMACDDFFCGERVAIITHFPIEIHVTEEHVPHYTSGMAIKYRDGTGKYYYRGTEYPGWWVEQREMFNLLYIGQITDGDKQSMAYDIYGWDRVLHDLNANVINVDNDEQIGTLYHVTLPGTSQPSALLKVLCGTGRTIVIPVSTEHVTARQANLRSYPGADYYELEVRT